MGIALLADAVTGGPWWTLPLAAFLVVRGAVRIKEAIDG